MQESPRKLLPSTLQLRPSGTQCLQREDIPVFLARRTLFGYLSAVNMRNMSGELAWTLSNLILPTTNCPSYLSARQARRSFPGTSQSDSTYNITRRWYWIFRNLRYIWA